MKIEGTMGLIRAELGFSYSKKPMPLLKWAGGKKQMLDILLREAPNKYKKYIEPFVGGGALFFALQNPDSLISDSNEELINLYKTVATNVEDVISLLKNMEKQSEFFIEPVSKMLQN